MGLAINGGQVCLCVRREEAVAGRGKLQRMLNGRSRSCGIGVTGENRLPAYPYANFRQAVLNCFQEFQMGDSIWNEVSSGGLGWGFSMHCKLPVGQLHLLPLRHFAMRGCVVLRIWSSYEAAER